MAKGKDKHVQRASDLLEFGKDLARRSGRACELCSGSGVGLQIYEVEPVPVQPEFSHCLFVCGSCAQQMELKKLNPEYWHCLQHSVWSEVTTVQVQAWLLLERLGAIDWATELRESVYLHEPAREWLVRAGKLPAE